MSSCVGRWEQHHEGIRMNRRSPRRERSGHTSMSIVDGDTARGRSAGVEVDEWTRGGIEGADRLSVEELEIHRIEVRSERERTRVDFVLGELREPSVAADSAARRLAVSVRTVRRWRNEMRSDGIETFLNVDPRPTGFS